MIRHADNGFVVSAGRSTLTFENEKKLCEALTAFYLDEKSRSADLIGICIRADAKIHSNKK